MGFFNPLKKSLGGKLIKKAIAKDPIGSKTLGGKMITKSLGGNAKRKTAGTTGIGGSAAASMVGSRMAARDESNDTAMSKMATRRATRGITAPPRKSTNTPPQVGNTGVVGPRMSAPTPPQRTPLTPRRRGGI